MASTRKKRALEIARKREKRGRAIVLAVLLIVIATGVGLYVYFLVQSGPPDFAITAPLGMTIQAGQPGRLVINVTAVNHFTGTVRLQASPSTGLIASLSPANITGSGTSVLSLSAPNNGTYTLTITGTSGSLSHTVSPRVATPVFATLLTSNGTITVELFQAQTPKTVANFVSLARAGFYKNLVWHRIVPGFVIQTGDPNTVNGTGTRSTWGQGGSSQTVPLEIDKSLHNNVGYLGMARSTDPNSGSSQFYINLANNNNLDGNYTVFGKVLANGMSIANAIASVPIYTNPQAPYYDQPIQPVYLDSVRIEP